MIIWIGINNQINSKKNPGYNIVAKATKATLKRVTKREVDSEGMERTELEEGAPVVFVVLVELGEEVGEVVGVVVGVDVQ